MDSNSETFLALPRTGRPSLVSDGLTTEIKSILSNLRISGCAITREVVVCAITREVVVL